VGAAVQRQYLRPAVPQLREFIGDGGSHLACDALVARKLDANELLRIRGIGILEWHVSLSSS
jgi:hypothetical protein